MYCITYVEIRLLRAKMQNVFGGHERQWMCLRGVVARITALALCESALILLSWAVSAATPRWGLMTGWCAY